jgi:ribonuclease P protein component
MKFPRGRRLTRRSEFATVRTEGKSWRGQFLALGWLRQPPLTDGPFRVGIITTKRLGGAVTRVRVRRKIRGILQKTGEEVAGGVWLVLIAQSRAAEASSAQLEKEWRWLLRKTGLGIPSPPPAP